MAAAGNNVDLVTVEFTWNGIQKKCQMPPELLQMINDPNCDPAVKESIYQELFQKDNSTPMEECKDKSEADTSNTSNEAECSSVAEKVHIWTEEEEKLLISAREDIDDEFHKLKNHEVLWARITTNMYRNGVKVTRSQVMNKWKNLKKKKKKKYREVLDENSKNNMEAFRCFRKDFWT